jgi:glycosyltransferase involved in cell wall biosynthesis
MTLRVLIAARWYPAHDNPGRGSFVADLVKALRAEGCDVRVASWEYAFYTRLASPQQVNRAVDLWADAVVRSEAFNTPRSWGAGVPVARLPAPHTTHETLGQQIDGHAATLVPFATALHDRWPFDVIHAHVGLPDGAAATRLGRVVDVPIVVTEHDRSLRERLPASPEAREAYRRMLHEAASTAAVSAQFRDLLCATLDVPTASMGVLPNALPAAFFVQPLDAPRDPDELLYVGARHENKGVATLLEAFALSHTAHPTLRLRLIGQARNPDEETRWERLAEDLGIRRCVLFDPPGDRLAIARAMGKAAVFVHPSPFESFGMVAAEALAAGLPIAATPSGVEEVVGTDGRFGEIATGFDARSLHEAIERVLERRGEFVPERLRERAARFEASNVARETIARYRSVIDARDGTLGAPRWEGRRHGTAGASAAARQRSLSSASDPASRWPLVVGLNPRVVRLRLGGLPRPLQDRLILLTRPKTTSDTVDEGLDARDAADAPSGDQPSGARVIEVDARGVYHARLGSLGAPRGVRWNAAQRVWHFLRSPRTALTRRRLRRDQDRFVFESAQRLILDAWQGIAATEGGTRPLLALDVDDVLRAQLAIDRGAWLAPGGVRWLADRWDAAISEGTAGR